MARFTNYSEASRNQSQANSSNDNDDEDDEEFTRAEDHKNEDGEDN